MNPSRQALFNPGHMIKSEHAHKLSSFLANQLSVKQRVSRQYALLDKYLEPNGTDRKIAEAGKESSLKYHLAPD